MSEEIWKTHCATLQAMLINGAKQLHETETELARLKGRAIALEAELESEKAAYKALRASSFVTAVPSEDYARLQAKVERLTKAGIAMGMALPDTDEANAAYRSFERVVKS